MNDAQTLARPATLVFLRRDGEVLLAMKKRGFGIGRYNGAGGKVEAGESVEQAMIRECQEEIGVTPLKFRKVAVQDFSGVIGGEPWANVVHTFVCDMWCGEPKETEEMAPRWFKTPQIPYGDMWEDDKLWLPLVLQGKLLQTTFTFDEHDHMLTHDIRVVERLDT